ncbi:hypothetical protein ACFP2T_37055 [Plantactinospora solaniradicis]|uniref:Uncharacterized protein n=1 Tax=Plantactinospora solaniradicis TaxID=1723736 RepID=A0ABW1KJ09_9ACTN
MFKLIDEWSTPMAPTSTMRRRLTRLLTTALAALAATLLMTSLTAAPAHAAWGAPLTVDLQLRSYSNGYEYRVGRVVGTVQFDDGNSHYLLSLVLCRQSSYTVPNVRIGVNGAPHQSFSNQDDQRRPESCGGGHGMSGTISGAYAYGGVIQNLTVGIEGIHFDGSTARYVSNGAFYDNPFN